MTAKCADEKNYDLKGAYIIKEIHSGSAKPLYMCDWLSYELNFDNIYNIEYIAPA